MFSLYLFIALFITISSLTNAYTIDRAWAYPSMEQRKSFDELELGKRFLPAKERRAPLEGFEDMSGFLRTIDGIQKPRFG